MVIYTNCDKLSSGSRQIQKQIVMKNSNIIDLERREKDNNTLPVLLKGGQYCRYFFLLFGTQQKKIKKNDCIISCCEKQSL